MRKSLFYDRIGSLLTEQMNKTLLRFKILQIIIDALLILIAFALAYFLKVGWFFSTDFSFPNYITIAVLTTPITIGLMFFARTYRLTQQVLSLRHIQRIAFVAIENVAVFMVLYYFTYQNFFSRMILVYIFMLTLVFVYTWHTLFRWILKNSFKKEKGVYRTLVIGGNRPAQQLVQLLVTERSHFKPVAVINAHGGHAKEIHGVPIVGKMDKFEKAIAEHGIDVILQADHLEQTVNVINYALNNNLRYMMPPELLGLFQGHQALEEVEGIPFLNIQKEKKWWHSIW